ncbi:MAG: sulfotransferase family protein [Planctomycetes bacterium]|nr:sulfotransferase family protein [Planctomycetota bacterium]
MTDSDRDFVTIVAGLPRSGTSMAMRIIDQGGIPALIDEIRKADEDNPKGYYEFEPVKKTKKDASWLETAPGKVVKMVYRLLYDLPDNYQYRIVFMKRRLEEVIASQNVMLDRKGKAGGSLSDEQLLATFRKEIEKIEQWLAEQPNFKTLYVMYNEVLEDAGPKVAAINEFLGGNLDTEKMLAVVDKSLYRQRK